MPMTPMEARELRAALSEALDPLYAARTGTIPALDGVTRAIARLHEVDAALLAVVNRAGAPFAFTPQQRERVIASMIGTEALSGLAVPRDVAERACDAAMARPLPSIGDDQEGRGMAPTRTDRDWEYLPDVRLRELEAENARLRANEAAVAEALDSCHATITLGSRDWGRSKDTAWLYGVLVGWEDAAEDPEGGALAEIVARFAMPPEAVARMRRLHAAVACVTTPGGDDKEERDI